MKNLLAILLTCLTIKINKTAEPWNSFDNLSLNRAKSRCVVYYPQSPCLKKFIKKQPKHYLAICGT